MLGFPLVVLKIMVRGFIWPLAAASKLLGRTGTGIEKCGPAKFIKAIEPVVVLIAIFGFAVDMSDRSDEHTARAWQLVVTKSAGSGKIEALEYLNSQDSKKLLEWWPYAKKRISLDGINLTPPDPAGRCPDLHKVDSPSFRLGCKERTYLRGATLPHAEMNNAKMSCTRLEDANLDRAKLRNSTLCYADLRKANLHGADLRSVDLRRADLRGARLGSVDN